MADPTKEAKFGEEKEKPDVGEGSGPPRSLGTPGGEFGQMSDPDRSGQQGQSGTGQADLGSQSATTLTGHTDQQDLGTDQPGRVAGAGEGFILREESGAESPSSAKATVGTDFAPQGRGAAEDEDEDSEGHPS